MKMAEYAFTTVAQVHRPSADAIRLHNSSYRMNHLPVVGNTFKDSGRGEAKVVDVIHEPRSGGLITVVLK
jgi:hypothetical protein